jgi:hypothetical protein
MMVASRMVQSPDCTSGRRMPLKKAPGLYMAFFRAGGRGGGGGGEGVSGGVSQWVKEGVGEIGSEGMSGVDSRVIVALFLCVVSFRAGYEMGGFATCLGLSRLGRSFPRQTHTHTSGAPVALTRIDLTVLNRPTHPPTHPPTHVIVVVEVLVVVDVVAALLEEDEVEEALRELGVHVGGEHARGRVRRLCVRTLRILKERVWQGTLGLVGWLVG